jgi:hypothetical protein
MKTVYQTRRKNGVTLSLLGGPVGNGGPLSAVWGVDAEHLNGNKIRIECESLKDALALLDGLLAAVPPPKRKSGE